MHCSLEVFSFIINFISDVFKKLQIINVKLHYKIKHICLLCYFILKKYWNMYLSL